MTKEINNNQDVINSYDVINRIKKLKADIKKAQKNNENWENEKNELDLLKALEEECKDCTGWQEGEDLIRYDYFTKYTRELCEDIGAIPSDLPYYISNHINWDGVANEIMLDYASIDFDGVEYLIPL